MNVNTTASLFLVALCFCTHAGESDFDDLYGEVDKTALLSAAVSEDQWLSIDLTPGNDMRGVSAGSYWSIGDASAFSMDILWQEFSAEYPGGYGFPATNAMTAALLQNPFAPAMELFDDARRTLLEFEETEDYLRGGWLRIGARYLVSPKFSLGLEVGQLKRHFDDSATLRVDSLTMAVQYSY